VDALAADVAANFKAYQAVFPNVRLGDVEPLGPPPGGDRPGSSWAKATQAWIDVVQARSGTKLAFIHDDITDWRRPLPEYLPAVESVWTSRSGHKRESRSVQVCNRLVQAPR
jgi:hypothetical protein